MDLVAAHGGAGRRRGPRARKVLCRLEHGRRRRAGRARRRSPAGALEAVRVGDAAAEHLVAAAKAEDAAAAARMREDVDVPALPARRRRRSASVAFEPGSRTRSASPATAAPAARSTSATRARPRAGRDRRNWRCAAGAARRSERAVRRRRRTRLASRAASSAGRRAAGGEPRHQAEGRPGRCARAIAVTAVVEQARVAAELVDDEAADARRSSASSTAMVPTRLAITPPRSMSPTRTTGTSAATAKPMLAMSPARRLISAGLPAPSTSTRSASARQMREALQHRAAELGLCVAVVARADACPRPGPARPPVRRRRSAASAAPGSYATLAATPQARACSAWARPISPPSAVDGGVVRHVLRLERPHPQAAPREGARKARRRAATCRHREPVPWSITAAAPPAAAAMAFRRACRNRAMRAAGRRSGWRLAVLDDDPARSAPGRNRARFHSVAGA